MDDWVNDVLSRKPIKVDDQTTSDAIEAEIRERLEALLASHNGLEPTLEGWRALALALAIRYEPAFQIKTPADRDSLGGRPVGFGNFTIRTAMKAEMRNGARSERSAAKAVGPKLGISPKRAQNTMSEPASPPDFLCRRRYEKVVEIAALSVAKEMSRK